MVYISIIIIHVTNYIFLHDIDLLWAAFSYIGPVKDMCTIPMHGHSGHCDSMWLHDFGPIKDTHWFYASPVSS